MKGSADAHRVEVLVELVAALVSERCRRGSGAPGGGGGDGGGVGGAGE